MKKNRLEKLFHMAKGESVHKARTGFEIRVMRAIRQEVPAQPASLLDQLNALFPRLALACAMCILLCLSAEVVLTNASRTDLVSGVASISEDWLFATKGF
jgi:hypothetical protein